MPIRDARIAVSLNLPTYPHRVANGLLAPYGGACCASQQIWPPMTEMAQTLQVRCTPKTTPCPVFPESDAKAEPWYLTRKVTATVAVTPATS